MEDVRFAVNARAAPIRTAAFTACRVVTISASRMVWN